MVLIWYSKALRKTHCILHYIHKKYSGTTAVFWTFTIVTPWYFWKYFGIHTKYHSKYQRFTITWWYTTSLPFIMPKKHGFSVMSKKATEFKMLHFQKSTL